MPDYRLSDFKPSDYMIEGQLAENTRSFKPITQEELVIFTIRAKISPAVFAWINFDVDRAFYITIYSGANKEHASAYNGLLSILLQ